MMRRMVCFLLVLMMTLSLACPVLATNSPGSGGTPSYTPPTDIPKTGDTMVVYAALTTMSGLGLATLGLKKKKESEE